MDIISGITGILNIFDIFFKLKDKIVSKEDKENVSEYLLSIGMILRDVAESFENNVYPHDKCMQIYTYLNFFKSTLINKIDDRQLEYLSKLIDDAYRVEQLFGELQLLTVEQRNSNINMLKSVSGAFIATSQIVKI